MLFSSRPINVLSDLVQHGSVQLSYTYGRGNTCMFTLDRCTCQLGLFQQMLDTMAGTGEQKLSFKITPRSAQGKPFTTGDDTLDQLAGNALILLEGACKLPETSVKVETSRREHRLIFPQVYLHLSTVHRGESVGEFAKATNLAISTKGTVIVKRIEAS